MPTLRPALALILIGSVLTAADEWPQFRGPTGQGHAPSADLPLTWSEQDDKHENITWKTALPGQGWSSPVIGGGKVWMTTALDNGRSLRALRVDAVSGKLELDVEVFKPESLQKQHALNSYASPTPVIEGDRVYVSFGTYGTACLDAATGATLWTSDAVRIQHANGAGSTPVLHGDRIFICCDGTDVQYMLALKKQDGTVAWRTDRSQKVTKGPEQRKAYGTPLVITVGGVDQVISTAAEWLYAQEAATGKELWRVHYPGYSNVPRPVHGLDLLFVCTGFDKPELWAIRPGGQGDVTASNVAWKLTAGAPTQSSPVLVGERLYFITDLGVASCLDAKSGKPLWKERLGGAASTSPTAAGNRVYFFDRLGAATVVDAAVPEFKVLAKNTLKAGCMASPAVLGKALFVRTKEALYRIETAPK